MTAAQNLAAEYGNPQVEPCHLLSALLTQENSLVAQLMKKMNVDPAALERAVQQEIGRMPSVTGSGREEGKVYISQETDRALTRAEKNADNMKDEYVSVEHLFMGLVDAARGGVKNLLGKADHDGSRQCDPNGDPGQNGKVPRLKIADPPEQNAQQDNGNIGKGLDQYGLHSDFSLFPGVIVKKYFTGVYSKLPLTRELFCANPAPKVQMASPGGEAVGEAD